MTQNANSFQTVLDIITERDKLRAFAQAAMEAWPQGDLDGADLQEAAVKHGLLAETKQFDTCGENCRCVEYYSSDEWAKGVLCYRKTALLTGAKT